MNVLSACRSPHPTHSPMLPFDQRAVSRRSRNVAYPCIQQGLLQDLTNCQWLCPLSSQRRIETLPRDLEHPQDVVAASVTFHLILSRCLISMRADHFPEDHFHDTGHWTSNRALIEPMHFDVLALCQVKCLFP